MQQSPTDGPRPAPPAPESTPPLRIAVIADVHGNLPALEAVLADLRGADPGLLVHLGDCASGPLWPRETLALLRGNGGGGAPSKLLATACTTRGNHDRWVAEGPGAAGFGPSDAFAAAALAGTDGAAWLGALPTAFEPAPGVAAFHGRPDDDNAYLLEDVVAGALAPAAPAEVARRVATWPRQRPPRLVLCAHSHRPGLLVLGGGRAGDASIWVVNPGSVGCPAYADPSPPHPHVSEAGSPMARYALCDVDAATGEPLRCELRAVAYDWRAAAARATSNNRPDWAAALATGRAA